MPPSIHGGHVLPLWGHHRDAQWHWRFLVHLKKLSHSSALCQIRRIRDVRHTGDWPCVSYLQAIHWLAQSRGWKRNQQHLPSAPTSWGFRSWCLWKAEHVKDTGDLFRAWHRRYPLQYYHLTFDYDNFPMHAYTTRTAVYTEITQLK